MSFHGEPQMKMCVSSIIVAVAIGLASSASTLAIAQVQEAIGIGDNDSVYVDPTTFKITPGKAKGDASPQIKNLVAQELSAGAIIFRSGNKLYIADGAPAV